jgi:hypothetical protein
LEEVIEKLGSLEMIYARGRWQKWARVATPLGGAARAWPVPPGGVGP